MEMENKLYELYTDPNLTETERSNKIFSEMYPLFLNKKTGSFFTSPDIANRVTKRCFERITQKKSIQILDPACGIGEFLISAANQILGKITGEREHSIEEELEIRKDIVTNYLFGYDIDERIVQLSKLRLLLWSFIPTFRKNVISFEDILLQSKIFKCNIEQADFFDVYQSQEKFDVILCNPPYNAAMSKSQEFALKEKFPSIIRNSAAYFYLLCESLLKSNGTMGFILPKSVAYSKRWRSLKNHILSRLDFVQDISKAFNMVKLEEIICITSNNTATLLYTTQDNSHKPIQVEKTMNSPLESIILSISPIEYEVFKQFSSLPGRLGEFITANRGLNIQKLAEKNEKNILDPIYCLGGKEIKQFFLKTPDRIIRKSRLKPNLELFKAGTILGQLANAHVKNPRPHYKLAFSKTPTSFNWISFDTVINISLKSHEDIHHKHLIDYLLCFLNSDIFSWYLYKIVYAGAIRSTRLDAEYLYKVPFVPIRPKDHKLLSVFYLLVECLTILSRLYYSSEKTNPNVTEMLKKSKFLMNSLVFMLFFSKNHLLTWFHSLQMDLDVKKSVKKIEDVSLILNLLWNSTFSTILQKLRATEQWKIMIIE